MSQVMPVYSVIIPAYDEAGTIGELVERVVRVMTELGVPFEVLVIDDGSADATAEVLARLRLAQPVLRVLRLQRRFGQTAALVAGFDHARGAVLITLDADLQNLPEDIPRLIARLEEGYDVVSGWRRRRQDGWFNRILPSWAANWLISRWTGLRLHDYGCTLKAYRRDAVAHLRLYGEMHRYIPVYLHWAGFRVGEAEVGHAPRQFGRSKYGWSRTGKVIIDLLTAKFLSGWVRSPSHIFGGAGLLCLVAASTCASVTLAQKLLWGVWVHRNPLLLVGIFLAISGLQLIFIGLLAELITRLYHESLHRPTYVLAEEQRAATLPRSERVPGGRAEPIGSHEP